ncbi:hypothetical protein Tsp_10975 [Trichinella spiralis]|uniref:hypothetical protein n=1 Tax=Trichinella spiralis TaxID=6334 RepID=UPI0001EFBE20|nr:hypothetical protein Tsp_10975 [Trichinella spiralis]
MFCIWRGMLISSETLQGQLLWFSLIKIFTPVYASYVTVILSVRACTSLLTHQEIFIHRIRYRALHYANNDRHKGALSSSGSVSFKRRLHGTEDARYEAQQQNARAHLNHFQCCAPGVSLL